MPAGWARAALLSTAAALTFGATATAQIQTPLGLMGEAPEPGKKWPHPAAPLGNPFPKSTASALELQRRDAKALLGKVLFWEEQVSTSNTISCGTCHLPEKGGTDGRGNALVNGNGRRGTFGVIPERLVSTSPDRVEYGSGLTGAINRGATDRNAPTMIGAYVFRRLFWLQTAGPGFKSANGAATNLPNFADFAALEDLSVVPAVNEIEMGHFGMAWLSPTNPSSGVLERKLGNSFPMALCDPNPAKMPPDFQLARALGLKYNQLFDLVFATDPEPVLAAGQGVTRARFGAAIAHYLRTLVPDQAPVDLGTLSANQQSGFVTFRQFCASCHSVSGGAPTGIQLAPGGGFVNPFDAPLSDGQFHSVRQFGGSVKTPTLRNVGLKRHFYSDGLVTTIAGVMAFEQATFGVPPSQIPNLQDFVMNGLTDPRVAAGFPPFDRPELASERPENAFEGNEFGAPISGNSTPEILANVPALIPFTGATSHFRAGVGNCLPSSAAVFGFQVLPSTSFSFLPLVSTNGNGIATSHVDLPPGAASPLAGLTVIGKWFVLDPGAPGGIAQSDSATWTLFQF